MQRTNFYSFKNYIYLFLAFVLTLVATNLLFVKTVRAEDTIYVDLTYNTATSQYEYSASPINVTNYVGDEYVEVIVRIHLNGSDELRGYMTLPSDSPISAVWGVPSLSTETQKGQLLKFKEITPNAEGDSSTGSYSITFLIKEGGVDKQYELQIGYRLLKHPAPIDVTVPTVTVPNRLEFVYNTPITGDMTYTIDGIGGTFTEDSFVTPGFGAYSGKIKVAGSDTYYSNEKTFTFTVNKGDTTISIPSDIKVGATSSVSPVASVEQMSSHVIVTKELDPSSQVEFYYKKKSDPDIDSSYSTTFPSEVGSYTVKTILNPVYSDNYNNAKTDFTISYLTAPDLVLSGRAGNNGYYTSDVTLKAPTGYSLSTTYGSGYVDSLEYKDVSNKANLYFKEKSTGALSDKVSMPSIKIDKVIPVISGINNSQTYYEASKDIVISDDNLDSATVNGKALTITDGKASTTLSANGGKTDYTVVAKDKAGLTVTYNVTLAAAWMEKGVIPTGSKVKLYKGTGYTLNAGKWKVSGDSTVYSGGQVFVASDKELTFSAE